MERLSEVGVTEQFKPVPVAAPSASPLVFALRLLVDLQLATIVQWLKPALATLHGKVLDVGAGESPWRNWLPAGTSYQGVDVGHAGDFGMTPQLPDVIYYEGVVLPVATASFDAVMCIEVLEHVAEPAGLLREISRALRAGGVLVLTVPWSARRHHVPHDYHRFTRERLQGLLGAEGFIDVRIRERGNDVCVIANKLIVLCIRLVRPLNLRDIWWTWPLALLAAPVSLAFLFSAHVSLALRLGSGDDPLGYFVQARTRALTLDDRRPHR